MKKFILSALFAGAMVLGPRAATAEHATLPEGQVALVVSGAIAAAETPQRVAFGLDTLRRFPLRDIRTTTYWHVGVQHFRGVPALTLLESLGVRAGTLTLTGADGYEVQLPVTAFRAHEPILALEWEGASIAGEAEGPVWLIFPYDGMSPEERERYTIWSVWALTEIRVGH